jgi:hypothetical protein
MIDISHKVPKANSFPIEIFGAETADSMIKVAAHYNIPVEYMGNMAMFTLAGLSGGMYIGNVNGGVKTMLYIMMIGPSGVGKTPAYRILCSSIVKDQFKKSHDQYQENLRIWKIKERAASRNGDEFTEPKPVLAVRMMTDGTPEGMIKKMYHSPCGFGVYYDEAGKVYNLTKYRGSGGGSADFWNEIWNGDPLHDVKADDERERYVHSPAASLCIGIQPDKLNQVITRESMDNGLSARMLFCESDYIHLNEDVNIFDNPPAISNNWRDIVSALHNKGLTNFFKDSAPYIVNFRASARQRYQHEVKRMLKDSNKYIMLSKKEDVSRIIISYRSKISQYFSRFCLLLAIYDDFSGPVISDKNVHDAALLRDYYFENGRTILTRLFNSAQEGISINEQLLFAELPENFTSSDCKEACEKLKLSSNYYSIALARGLKDKVRRISRGQYEKL